MDTRTTYAHLPLLVLSLWIASCGGQEMPVRNWGDAPTAGGVERDEAASLDEDMAGGEPDMVEAEAPAPPPMAPAAAGPVPTSTGMARPTRQRATTVTVASDEASSGARVQAAEEPPSASDAGGAEPATPQSWRRVAQGTRFATVSLGGGHSLELERVRVTVEVEGFRARTVVDHVFKNPYGRSLEGTFRYALPPEASVSSYAMFVGQGRGEPSFFGPEDAVRRHEEAMQGFEDLAPTLSRVNPEAWGELRVGRIVRAERGREVYEEVTRRRVDPALVEEVAPNTFEARVFPIAAGGYQRVIVSYEQTLPRIDGALEYLFPVPTSEGGGASLKSFEFALSAKSSGLRSLRYTGDIAGARPFETAGEKGVRLQARGPMQGGNLAVRLTPRRRSPVEVLVGSDPSSSQGERHFAVRLVGDGNLPGGANAAGAPQAVFLLDTSLSEDPDRFNLDVELMRRILERNRDIRRFNVLTFDAGARWLSQRWLTNDADGREEAIERVGQILLEGATSLGAALTTLAHPPMDTGDGRLDAFLLTDGAVSWGERDAENLLARFERESPWDARLFAYRTGLGAEDVRMLRRLTRRGAIFNCLSRSALEGCATAHRHGGLKVTDVSLEGAGEGGARAHDLLLAGGVATLTRGAEVLVAGRLDRPGAGVLRFRGEVAGRPAEWRVPVELVGDGELAPRLWAEVAVQHLLATHDEELEELAVALGQRYRVPSRVTSFLVLTTDAEYEQYDLGQRRRAAGNGEIAELASQARRAGSALTSFERMRRALRAGGDHNHLFALEDGRVWRDLSRMIAHRPISFLRNSQAIPAVLQGDVSRRYRRHRPHEAGALEVYRREAERRRDDGELGAAVRSLSSAVENAPASAEVARSVGYELMAWGARAEAAELFASVLERRPYEPQSYRDLAGALWLARPSMTAALYEAVLAGEWSPRFRGVVEIVREEYALFTRALMRTRPNAPLAAWLRDRQQSLGLTVPDSDLRVTMTWNTDNTDIDLWVTDPSGEKCYYAHRNLESGGVLLADVTQGFGPERFQAPRALHGDYRVQAHYYGNNGNRLLAETYVTLVVAKYVGSPQEQVRRYTVRLGDRGDIADVARVEM